MRKSFISISILVLFIILPFLGLSRAQKSVITSVEINGDTLIVVWNQLEPIAECFTELVGFEQDTSIFYSPPEDPVSCDTIGQRTKTVTLSRVQGVTPLYTVIIDNITGEIVSNYVMVRGEPGKSNSPPNTPPVRMPLRKVF